MSDRLFGNLQIDTVSVPGTEGTIGMCACPGGRRFQALVGRLLREERDGS